jgi:apolipoprotein N-acyltransferase
MQASKHPNLIAFAAGALATLALPPINILPLLFLSLGLLLAALLKTENKKQAFARGWWWGFGYFTFGLYWIAFALMVDIARFWWLVPLAVFALPAMMAIYIGFVGMAMQVVARRFQQKQLVMILSFPARPIRTTHNSSRLPASLAFMASAF